MYCAVVRDFGSLYIPIDIAGLRASPSDRRSSAGSSLERRDGGQKRSIAQVA